MFRSLSSASFLCVFVTACGAAGLPEPRAEPPQATDVRENASVVAPPIRTPLVGPFTDVADQVASFAAPYLNVTLPPRTRSVDEVAAAQLDAYSIDDDLRTPEEKLVYEVDACLLVLTSRRTTQLSPRAVFERAESGRSFESLGLRRVPSSEPNLALGTRLASDSATLRLVIFQRDYYAVETDVTAEPLSEESFDEDPSNDDDWRERPDASERQNICQSRAESWLEATLSSLRANATPPLETEVSVAAPSGTTYAVELPEGATGYTGEWYHGAETYLAVRTEYGQPDCGSILVSASDSDYLYFEPPPNLTATESLLGARLYVVPDTEEPDEGCQSRVLFIPRLDSSTYHTWLMRMRGDDQTLAPLLEAMRRARPR